MQGLCAFVPTAQHVQVTLVKLLVNLPVIYPLLLLPSPLDAEDDQPSIQAPLVRVGGGKLLVRAASFPREGRNVFIADRLAVNRVFDVETVADESNAVVRGRRANCGFNRPFLRGRRETSRERAAVRGIGRVAVEVSRERVVRRRGQGDRGKVAQLHKTVIADFVTRCVCEVDELHVVGVRAVRVLARDQEPALPHHGVQNRFQGRHRQFPW